MKTKRLEIRDMEGAEIRGLSPMTPEAWQYDLADFFEEHFGKAYFKAMVAAIDGEIVGTVNGIVNGNAGWLGNIVVKQEYRGHGIGSKLTSRMIDHLRSGGCPTLLLIATEMGELVYTKLGFRASSSYRFYVGGRIEAAPETDNLREIVPDDLPSILELDREVLGEDRKALITGFPLGGWLYVDRPSNRVRAFYLASLGEGPILARDGEAGSRLLQLKHHIHEKTAALPEDNELAIGLLKENGFEERYAAKRMVLGPEADWRPRLVFSRAGPSCG